MYKLVTMIVLSVATIGIASASDCSIQAPEIDPASASSGMALLLGSLAVIRGRFKKQ